MTADIFSIQTSKSIPITYNNSTKVLLKNGNWMPMLSKLETFKQRKPLLECYQEGLETTVSLYVGCIAQIILNLNTSDGLVNESFGIVISCIL